jgi:hypothetical protein
LKQRILVMNGQRLVETQKESEWTTTDVAKAGPLKPGIYNIYLASQADKSKSHDGAILHIDKDHVYQQIGKAFVKHNAADFSKLPEIGSNLSIKYDDSGKTIVSQLSNSIKKGLSR